MLYDFSIAVRQYMTDQDDNLIRTPAFMPFEGRAQLEEDLTVFHRLYREVDNIDDNNYTRFWADILDQCERIRRLICNNASESTCRLAQLFMPSSMAAHRSAWVSYHDFHRLHVHNRRHLTADDHMAGFRRMIEKVVYNRQ